MGPWMGSWPGTFTERISTGTWTAAHWGCPRWSRSKECKRARDGAAVLILNAATSGSTRGRRGTEEGGDVLFEAAPAAVLVLDAANVFTHQQNQKKKSVSIRRGNGGRAGSGMKEAVEQPFQERRGRGGRGSVGKQGQGRRQGALFREKGRQGGKLAVGGGVGD
jgi:hypothetical protein